MDINVWVYRTISKETLDATGKDVEICFAPQIIADIFQSGVLSVFVYKGKMHLLAFEQDAYRNENIWHKRFITQLPKQEADLFVTVLRQNRNRGNKNTEQLLSKILQQIAPTTYVSKMQLYPYIDYDDLDHCPAEVDMGVLTINDNPKKIRVTHKVHYKLPEFVFRYNIISAICDLED